VERIKWKDAIGEGENASGWICVYIYMYITSNIFSVVFPTPGLVL
jgi:hypothetical protein